MASDRTRELAKQLYEKCICTKAGDIWNEEAAVALLDAFERETRLDELNRVGTRTGSKTYAAWIEKRITELAAQPPVAPGEQPPQQVTASQGALARERALASVLAQVELRKLAHGGRVYFCGFALKGNQRRAQAWKRGEMLKQTIIEKIGPKL